MLNALLKSDDRKKNFYIITLFFFSIFFNQYYGNKGICPIDSFFTFNSAYDILNGYYPFKDYWTITGPFLSLTQAVFFKIFGTSWSTYVLQASVFNFIISFSTFYVLFKLRLNINFCFIYALSVAVLANPSAGSPYVDHQSAILSIISIFCFILAIKSNKKIYWFFLPILLGISFLTKQAPTAHIFIIIFFLSSVYFVNNFNKKNFLFGLFGSVIVIGTFCLIMILGKISFISFYQQYILFPMSLGSDRLEFLFPLEFSRVFLRFKLIHLASFLLIFISFKKIIKNVKYLKSDEFLISLSLIATSYAFIAHQLMTINGIFIFFIIPILSGFSHIWYVNNFKDKKYISYLILLLTITSTFYYGYKYIHKRDFMDLKNVNMKNSIDANFLSPKLKGLNWISCVNPDNPKDEINRLLRAIEIIKNDKREKTLITDYQFISVILSSYDYSPSQVWYSYHVNPNRGSKYYDIYKKFFINILVNNKIKVIYIVKPLWDGLASVNHVNNVLSKECIKKKQITKILDSYELLPCKDLN